LSLPFPQNDGLSANAMNPALSDEKDVTGAFGRDIRKRSPSSWWPDLSRIDETLRRLEGRQIQPLRL
jgi:hypothetical protein